MNTSVLPTLVRSSVPELGSKSTRPWNVPARSTSPDGSTAIPCPFDQPPGPTSPFTQTSLPLGSTLRTKVSKIGPAVIEAGLEAVPKLTVSEKAPVAYILPETSTATAVAAS